MALVAVLVAMLVISERPAALAHEAPRGPTCRHAKAAQDLRGRAIVGRKNEVSEEAGRSVQIPQLVGRQRPFSGRLRTHLQHVLGCSDHHDRYSVVDLDDIAVLELFAPGGGALTPPTPPASPEGAGGATFPSPGATTGTSGVVI